MAIKPEGADKDDPGLDFPGFGPQLLRRANTNWRHEVGGSSVETSKIAGHASTAITEAYTLVGLHRQDELTPGSAGTGRATRSGARRTDGPQGAKSRRDQTQGGGSVEVTRTSVTFRHAVAPGALIAVSC